MSVLVSRVAYFRLLFDFTSPVIKQLLNTPRALLLIVAVVSVTLFSGLNNYPLLDPDEGRNAEVAREMARSNNFLVPTLNALPYVDKPVLYFATAALSIKLFGATAPAARLASVLFTLATILILARFATRRGTPQDGVITAIALGSMPLVLAFSRTVIFDSALMFFVTLAVTSWYDALEHYRTADPQAPRPWSGIVAWLAVAGAVLTKGPIGLILPALIVVPFAVWKRTFRPLLDIAGILGFVALLLPWVSVMVRSVPDYVSYVVNVETIGRFTTDSLRRDGPWWYFLPIIVAAALPWTFSLVFGTQQAIRRRRDADGYSVFLLLWVVIPLVFFSFSQSKRPHYILPLLPAVALMAGHQLGDLTARREFRRVAAPALALLGLVLLAAPSIVPRLLDVDANVVATLPVTSYVLGGITTLAGIVLFRPLPLSTTLLVLAFPVISIPWASAPLMQAIGADRSHAHVASTIRPLLTPSTEVIAVETFPLSLPFYLEHPLVLSSDDAAELTSNYLTRYHDSFRSPEFPTLKPVRWWREALQVCERPRIFVIDSDNADARRTLSPTLPLVIQTSRIAVYGPCAVRTLVNTPY